MFKGLLIQTQVRPLTERWTQSHEMNMSAGCVSSGIGISTPSLALVTAGQFTVRHLTFCFRVLVRSLVSAGLFPDKYVWYFSETDDSLTAVPQLRWHL